MLSLGLNRRIFLYSLPTDMRKGFDGLSGLVRQHFDPPFRQVFSRAWRDVTCRPRDKLQVPLRSTLATSECRFVEHLQQRMPMYTALQDTGQLYLANNIFAKARKCCHAVSANSVEKLLAEAGQQ